MKKYLAIVLVCSIALLTGGTLLATQQAPQRQQQQEPEKPDFPVIDFEAVKAAGVSRSTDARQRQKAVHYNQSPLPWKIEDMDESATPLPTAIHWYQDLSAIPVNHSSAVVIGRIVNRKALLSDDGRAVFSEYTIAVEETLKGEFQANSEVTATRYGGAVKTRSGKLDRYYNFNQKPPLLNRRYVLFLNDDKILSIVTGYELLNGFATPLDGSPEFGLPFEKFRGMEESEFLDKVRAAMKGENK